MTKDDFKLWMADSHTKLIFSLLRERREQVNKALTDANLIMSPNSQVTLARLVGERDAYDSLLEMVYDDISYDVEFMKEEEDKDVEYRTSRTQDPD